MVINMDDNFVKKVMPHNQEAEKSVIGSMFIDREALLTVSEILNEHNNFWDSFSFYDRIFKDICSECLLV